MFQRLNRLALALVVSTGTLASVAHAQQPTLPPGLKLTIVEPVEWSGASTRGGFTPRVRNSFRVSGSAQHPSGIAEILLNKNRAAIDERADGSADFVGYIRVGERMTSAEITVVTRTGERVPVRYPLKPTEAPKPAAPTPTAALDERLQGVGFSGERYAVVIGISEYESKDMPKLEYADDDAKAFYEFLRSDFSGLGGFKKDNITILLNQRATFKNMRVALFDFLKRANEEDVVYIYFAGHGAPDPDRPQNLYLLPYDADPTSMAGSGFSMEEMNKALNEVKAAHKILITDACHSGGVIAGGGQSTRGFNDINDAFHRRLSSSRGVHTTFTASGPRELSRESKDWGGGHGVFTYYLIEGLKGAADINKDHLVDLGEMMDFTRESVSRETRNAQNPMWGETASNLDFPVSMVVPGTTIPNVPLEAIDSLFVIQNAEAELMKFPWVKPDSAVLVTGITDTLVVRLQNDTKDVVNPALLRWTSSNTAVATVDAHGVVTPVGAGTATIKAARDERNVSALVRVLPRPVDVIFKPVESSLQLVLTESFIVESDLVLGPNQVERGMPPRIALPDSLILRREGAVKFVAEREGTVTLSASIGGRTKEWNVRVIPPNVKIKPLPVAVALSDSLPISAWRVRPDGTQLGEAPDATWISLDTARAVIRNGKVHTRGIGRASFVAQLKNAADTTHTFVLGDLLVATEGTFGKNIGTVSIAQGALTPLLPKTTSGAQPALSPKGDRIAFVSNKRLYIMDTDGSNMKRLTPDMKGALGVRTSSYEEHTPSWTNDGQRIVFVSNAHGNYEVMSIGADGTNVQRLTDTNGLERNVATAPDAPRIAFERSMGAGSSDLVVALPDGTQEQQFLTKAALNAAVQFSEHKPRFLPGGTQLVYVKRSNKENGESLHVMNLTTGTSTKDLVPAQKEHSLIYAVSPDGKRIAYHLIAEWGKKNSSIVIIDLDGTVIKNISLGAGVEIKDIAWGAVNSSR